MTINLIPELDCSFWCCLLMLRLISSYLLFFLSCVCFLPLRHCFFVVHYKVQNGFYVITNVINSLFKQNIPCLCTLLVMPDESLKSLNSEFLLVNWKASSAFKSECCVRHSKAFQNSVYIAFTVLSLSA